MAERQLRQLMSASPLDTEAIELLRAQIRDTLSDEIAKAASVGAMTDRLSKLWKQCYYPLAKKSAEAAQEAHGFYTLLALSSVSAVEHQFAALPRTLSNGPDSPAVAAVQLQESLMRLSDLERYVNGDNSKLFMRLIASSLMVPFVSPARAHLHLANAAVRREEASLAVLHLSLSVLFSDKHTASASLAEQLASLTESSGSSWHISLSRLYRSLGGEGTNHDGRMDAFSLLLACPLPAPFMGVDALALVAAVLAAFCDSKATPAFADAFMRTATTLAAVYSSNAEAVLPALSVLMSALAVAVDSYTDAPRDIAGERRTCPGAQAFYPAFCDVLNALPAEDAAHVPLWCDEDALFSGLALLDPFMKQRCGSAVATLVPSEDWRVLCVPSTSPEAAQAERARTLRLCAYVLAAERVSAIHLQDREWRVTSPEVAQQRRAARLMTSMAAERLRSEVRELEGTASAKRSVEHIVVDSTALVENLAICKRIVQGGGKKHVLVITATVLRALDAAKDANKHARTISRWITTVIEKQEQGVVLALVSNAVHLSVDGSLGLGPQGMPLAECAAYFLQRGTPTCIWSDSMADALALHEGGSNVLRATVTDGEERQVDIPVRRTTAFMQHHGDTQPRSRGFERPRVDKQQRVVAQAPANVMYIDSSTERGPSTSSRTLKETQFS